MSQTSEDLDKKLREEGYTPSSTDSTKYEKVNDRGTIDRAYTNGDWVQESGSNVWMKK